MKIKNSLKGLRLGITVPVGLGAVVILSVIRAVQMAKFIDSETGFFVGGDAFNMLFYILIVALCVFFAVVSFLSYEGKKVELVAFQNKNAGIGAAVFAAALIYDLFDSFVESAKTLTDMPELAILGSTEKFKALMSSGALPYMLQSIFAFFSAFYLIILAKSFLKGTVAAHNHKLIAIAPIAWAGFKMITRFVKQISYVKVSDLLLELMMLGFMMLFFVGLSQVISGVYSDDSRWRITAFGFSSGIIAICLNLPRLIFTFVSKELINFEYPFNMADAFFGLFAIFVAIAAVKSVENNATRE